jgi:hypothetical protein
MTFKIGEKKRDKKRICQRSSRSRVAIDRKEAQSAVPNDNKLEFVAIYD